MRQKTEVSVADAVVVDGCLLGCLQYFDSGTKYACFEFICLGCKKKLLHELQAYLGITTNHRWLMIVCVLRRKPLMPHTRGDRPSVTFKPGTMPAVTLPRTAAHPIRSSATGGGAGVHAQL